MATIAKGVVQIDGRDNTKKAFGTAKKSANGMATAMKAAAAAIALVAGAKAMGRMIKTTLDFADAIGKTARRADMSVEFVQLWGTAMGEAGVGGDQANTALETFSRRLGKAKLDTGAMIQPLNNFNTELLDSMKAAGSSEEAFGIFMTALEGIEDPATRAAVAAGAFGDKLGSKIAGGVDVGVGGLQELMKEIGQTKTVMNAEQIAMAEQANDAMGRVGDAWVSAKNSIVVDAAGPIVKASEWILSTAWPNMKKFGENMGDLYDGYIKPGWDRFKTAIEDLTVVAAPHFDTLMEAANEAGKFIGIAFYDMQAPMRDFLGTTTKISRDFGGEIHKIVTATQEVAFGIGLYLGNSVQLVRDWYDKVSEWTGKVVTSFNYVVDFVKLLPTVFAQNFSKLTAPVKEVWNKIIKMFNDGVDKIKSVMESSTSWMPDWLNPFKKGAEKTIKETRLSVSNDMDGLAEDMAQSSGELEVKVVKNFEKVKKKTIGEMRAMRLGVNQAGKA